MPDLERSEIKSHDDDEPVLPQNAFNEHAAVFQQILVLPSFKRQKPKM